MARREMMAMMLMVMAMREEKTMAMREEKATVMREEEMVMVVGGVCVGGRPEQLKS